MNKLMLLILFLLLAGGTAVSGSFSQDAADNAVSVDEVKAALVFKFPDYVQWPDNVLNDETKNFECCILGDDTVSELLKDVEGVTIKSRKLKIKPLTNISEMRDCHLLFIGPSEEKNLESIFSTIEEKPVLTIGDIKGFTQKGGMINLIIKGNSIGFEINPKAAERAGLKISSKLLRLAEIVEKK